MSDEQNRLDFLISLGQEFCTVMDSLVKEPDDLSPQVAYEIFSAVLGKDFDADSLRSLSNAQLEALATRARSLFESPTIGSTHLREVVQHTLARWG